jgi:taurine dioxygenase
MSKFGLEPMPVGAEVVDLEPGSEADPAVAKDLYDAWLDHGMLLFRNVDTVERHLALSAVFGEAELHPLPQFRDPEEPLLMPLGDESGPAHVYDGTDLRRGRLPWHRDTAYTQAIAKGGMLRLREVPEAHGETLFADTGRAYDDLPQDVKDQVDDLEFKASFHLQFLEVTRPGSLWKSTRLATTDEYPPNEQLAAASQELSKREFAPVVHPVVVNHPESGRRCLFLSPKDAECILGLSPDESDELLEFLVSHMTQEQYVYAHPWEVDDAIVWDNRRMLHAAAGYRVDHHRRGQRTTLAGPLNAGRPFDPATDGGPVKPSPVPVA